MSTQTFFTTNRETYSRNELRQILGEIRGSGGVLPLCTFKRWCDICYLDRTAKHFSLFHCRLLAIAANHFREGGTAQQLQILIEEEYENEYRTEESQDSVNQETGHQCITIPLGCEVA